MIEAVVSIAVIGVLTAAAVATYGAARTAQSRLLRRQTAAFLADSLLTEITRQSYADPDQSPAFGPESGETGSTRAAFDDVDDYHNWSASPPQEKDGAAMSGYAGWKRRVTVVRVNANLLTQLLGSDTGVKRIEVTVLHDDVPLATRYAYRTAAW
jgi:type II secretory pathway pseudopilin PulG